MAVNDKIRVPDYNDIVTIVQRVLGNGSIDKGYGQTIESSNVSEGDSVTVNEWGNLLNDLKTIGRHQNGTTPSLPVATEGNIVKFNTTTEPYSRYLSVAQGFETNRFSLGANQFITVNKGTQPRTFSWSNQAECTVTIQFDSHDNARYFFNSGGLIRLESSRSGGTTTGGPSTIAQQNQSWTSLLSSAGEIDFGGNTPGTGTSPNNGQNFYRLSTSYTSAYNTETASSPYGSNDWFLFARYDGAGKLEIRSVWDDGHTFHPTGGGPDGVDGTLDISAVTVEPAGTRFPSGTFAVESPTVTFSAITGS